MPVNDTAIDDDFVNKVGDLEGYGPYMYKDARNNVTAGYGRMLDKPETAKNTLFRIGQTEDDRYATPHEIEQAYKKIQAAPAGKDLGFYEPGDFGFDKIYITKKDAQNYLDETLIKSEEELRKKFSDYESYPRPARQAMIDMQFNMGDGRFDREYYENGLPKRGWPNLMDAIETQDWQKAAKESHRSDVQEPRNDAIFKLFMDAYRESENR